MLASRSVLYKIENITTKIINGGNANNWENIKMRLRMRQKEIL